jgi:hypothetical protein
MVTRTGWDPMLNSSGQAKAVTTSGLVMPRRDVKCASIAYIVKAVRLRFHRRRSDSI